MFQAGISDLNMHTHFLIPASSAQIGSSFLMHSLWFINSHTGVAFLCAVWEQIFLWIAYVTLWVKTRNFCWHWVLSWRKKGRSLHCRGLARSLLSIVTASIGLLWELCWWVSGVSGSFSSMSSLQALGCFNFTLRSHNNCAWTLERYQWLYNCWGFHFIWTFHTIPLRYCLHRPHFREPTTKCFNKCWGVK